MNENDNDNDKENILFNLDVINTVMLFIDVCWETINEAIRTLEHI